MPEPGRASAEHSHHRAAGTDVIVIGAGLAGLTAAVHAVRAGAKVRLIAQGWGQQMVTPGWISVCDRAEDDVIAEVRGYAALHPDHPYALAEDDAMVHGLDSFRRLAEEIGLPYDMRQTDGHNLRLPTMLGAIQTPMIAPRGMASGDLTGISGPVLLVGFKGWRDFHAELAAGNLQAQGVEARAIRVDLPVQKPGWDFWPGELARTLDTPDPRAAVIRQVRPLVQGAVKVGFPAVLGMDRHADVLHDFGQQLERPCFEIPTLPPSPSGTRLSNRLRRWLLRHGARIQIGQPVVRGIVQNGRCTGVEVEALGHASPFYADQVILATGGLYNGGILSDEAGRLWEPIFDLPVQAPPGDGREGWTYDHLLKHRGHPIHRLAGLRVSTQMRPLDAEGAPVLENVYTVGHLLAGFNPLTDGCAEGIALATAYKAVQTALGLEE
ncbi:MAG TPA: anaerobic glycerol-3-phosphate dehydrogenase subunit GlpB [Aggregatilineaceae bacterium]|jgi:glycerol-3-phosphate dehydrogenase subunit B|nr:anaerobic glycerol-3-phosphate dehydrogenase subunit GlpB [Aggregatilineaceae bacterium]